MFPVYEELCLEGIRKVTISSNEFYIKYLTLVENPESKFLLYQSGEKSIDMDNRLLDLNLAYYEFHTEASSLYPSGIGNAQGASRCN
ncbi:MAG: hypothetical protein AB9882_09060 [Ignavibacteriaceae bacterium]